MQTDFTWANELRVTITGDAFPHILCHPCLPYLNWEWATFRLSESMAALKCGVQTTHLRLGRVPPSRQTGHSTAATHGISGHRRGFNEDYVAFMRHFGIDVEDDRGRAEAPERRRRGVARRPPPAFTELAASPTAFAHLSPFAWRQHQSVRRASGSGRVLAGADCADAPRRGKLR